MKSEPGLKTKYIQRLSLPVPVASLSWRSIGDPKPQFVGKVYQYRCGMSCDVKCYHCRPPTHFYLSRQSALIDKRYLFRVGLVYGKAMHITKKLHVIPGTQRTDCMGINACEPLVGWKTASKLRGVKRGDRGNKLLIMNTGHRRVNGINVDGQAS